ncbi:MAG TPA: hypothetical protein VF100_03090 [Thermoanaerobaculia bacterium]
MPLRAPNRRRALSALLVAVALVVPALAVPAAPAAAGLECESAGSCPLAAAGACRSAECCARPAAPTRPLPLEQAAPVAGAQLVAPPPAVVALVVPSPPVSRQADPGRPLHGTGASVPLFTLHASFLI